MSDSSPRPAPRRSRRALRTLQVLVISGATLAAAIAILTLPIDRSASQLTLKVGDVTSSEIIAPSSITYVSQVQTDLARETAAAAVPDVYDPPDSRVAREQVARAQQILDFIGSVRNDSFATTDQRLSDLGAITDFSLDPDLARGLLSLSDADWSAVRIETVSVIERVMSGRVRADRVEDARNQVPALVSVSLPLAQADLVTQLTQPFIAANSFFNEAATRAAREAARETVTPISQSFVQGQAVIGRSRVVTHADIEAVTALGLLQPANSPWQDVLGNALTVAIGMAIFSLFIRRDHPKFVLSPRLMLFVAGSSLVFLLAARIMVPGRTVLPFLFPSTALALIMAIALGPNAAVTVTIVFAALISNISGGRLDITAYVAVGGIVGALTVGRADRINAFFRAGLLSALVNFGTILVFQLSGPSKDAVGLATLMGASLANGLISAAATLAVFFVLGGLFDIYTPLQLIEIARPNHPLLQFLLRQAPGTYQHSLQVANLAEQAGERVGADTALIRVGAMFHDVGKSIHPEYFVENQIEGQNPHDGLLPHISAQVIIEHVPNGLQMAAKHRLPQVIRNCIAEHHGTNLTYYQYQRAVQNAGGDETQVDKSKYHYPGPRPQSRETALLMLADGCEAKSRSDRPRNEEEIDKIVRYIFDRTLAANQLDECELTLHDLRIVRESFVESLKGFFHSRISYPEEKLPLVSDEEVALRR
jgi:putative nucleotidyltransferase with HDIG domain